MLRGGSEKSGVAVTILGKDSIALISQECVHIKPRIRLTCKHFYSVANSFKVPEQKSSVLGVQGLPQAILEMLNLRT